MTRRCAKGDVTNGIVRWGAGAAMLIAVGALTTACASTHSASFLTPTSHTMLTDRNPVPPGQRFAIMLAPVVSGTATPITLQSVHLTGAGVGSVVRVISVSAGPDRPPGQATPEGTFDSEPPVWHVDGQRCIVQRLEPLHGLVLQHAQEVRLYVVLQALRPGRLQNTGYQVTYTVNGTTYTQDIPVGYTTWVRAGVSPRKPEPPERACISHSHLL
jgi:hypothetical protein